MKSQCIKCGAINSGKSKWRWFISNGKKWCGCCGAIKKG